MDIRLKFGVTIMYQLTQYEIKILTDIGPKCFHSNHFKPTNNITIELFPNIQNLPFSKANKPIFHHL